MKRPVTPSCAGVLVKQIEPLQVPTMFFMSMNAPLPAAIWMGAVNPLGKLNVLKPGVPLLRETDDAETVLPVKSTVGEVMLNVPVLVPSLNVTGVPPTTLSEKEPVFAAITSGGVRGPYR